MPGSLRGPRHTPYPRYWGPGYYSPCFGLSTPNHRSWYKGSRHSRNSNSRPLFEIIKNRLTAYVFNIYQIQNWFSLNISYPFFKLKIDQDFEVTVKKINKNAKILLAQPPVHDWDSLASPLQVFPPYWGFGFVQVRERFDWLLPQM